MTEVLLLSTEQDEPAPDPRAEYIAGLRALAAILEDHPELPLPYHGTGSELLWIEHGDREAARSKAQAFARLIPGQVTKTVRDKDGAFDLIGRVHGVGVQMILNRDAVCTRRVVAVREVTKQVPDPDALAAVPTVTVVEAVEDVEWDCGPILAQVPSGE